MSVTTAVVARQPIVDVSGQTVGFELLYRPLPTSVRADDPAAGTVLSGDEMTSEVMFGALAIGLRQLAGDKTIFCNADRGVLTGLIPMRLPPQQTVIEVLETVAIDDEVLDGCRTLRRAGFSLAADDFMWVRGAEQLMELVDTVKVDVQSMPMEQVAVLAERCRGYGVTLLAEKIETSEELTACQELGFDLFQGYFLGRPQTMTGPALAPSQLGLLRLAKAVLDDNANYNEIEMILRMEPALSYQLVQLATMGRMGGTRRQVRSIRQALVDVGLERLRGLIPTLLLRPTGRAAGSALQIVLSRARMVELLAEQQYPSSGGFAFTAGMLSAFDLLLGVPRHRLASVLDIPGELADVAFRGEGPIGELITDVINFERYGPDPAHLPELSSRAIQQCAPRARRWATRAVALLDDDAV